MAPLYRFDDRANLRLNGVAPDEAFLRIDRATIPPELLLLRDDLEKAINAKAEEKPSNA
jgi:hypothetical protein